MCRTKQAGTLSRNGEDAYERQHKPEPITLAGGRVIAVAKRERDGMVRSLNAKCSGPTQWYGPSC